MKSIDINFIRIVTDPISWPSPININRQEARQKFRQGFIGGPTAAGVEREGQKLAGSLSTPRGGGTLIPCLG